MRVSFAEMPGRADVCNRNFGLYLRVQGLFRPGIEDGLDEGCLAALWRVRAAELEAWGDEVLASVNARARTREGR